MSGGRADQIGVPEEIYNRPATRFVAEFIGALNLLPGTLGDPAVGLVETATGPLPLSRPVDPPAGAGVTLAIRPKMMRVLSPDETAPGHAFTGRLLAREFLVPIIRLRTELQNGPVFSVDCFNRDGTHIPDIGKTVRLGLHPLHPLEMVVLDE